MVRDSRLQAADDLPGDAPLPTVPPELARHGYDSEGYCTGCPDRVTWLACPVWAEYQTARGRSGKTTAGELERT